MQSKSKVFLILLTAVYNGSAFQVAPRRPVSLSLRQKNTHLRVGEAMPLEENTNTNFPTDEEVHSVILAGTSPKAIRLRKKLQEVWSSPKTSPVLIIGPRGSGKSSIVEELLDQLPSSQKESVHKLSMDDAVNHIDTMLGLETEAGLLDILSDKANTTLVLRSFQSRSVESADEFDRRQELFNTIAKLFTDRTFYSRHEGKEKAFAPRIIATCTRQPDFLDDTSNVFLVKVPALDSRTQDMEAIATAEIKLLEKNLWP